MGVRLSKSFKIAPGVKLRVNAKSTSVTLGGKGMHYTVNSKGRRTTTARIPGAPLSVQKASGTRRSAPPRRAQSRRAPSPRAVKPQTARPSSPRAAPLKPGWFAPKGEKHLYAVLATDGIGSVNYAARCEAIAARYPCQRIAALTLAGLFLLKDDPARAIRDLGEVFSSRIEIANDDFLRRYAPVRTFPMPAGDREVAVPLSRDLIGMRLVQLHTRAGQFDWAESAAAELKDCPVAQELFRRIAAARQVRRLAQGRGGEHMSEIQQSGRTERTEAQPSGITR